MKKVVYWGSTFLVSFLFSLLLIGCSKTTQVESVEEDTLPGWQRDADDLVTFDWYVNFSWFTTPWGENAVSQKITEETGININFITPTGNESEKFDALISSDTLPDIITLGWWESQVDIMINKDMVYALNELADEYDAYFWEVADSTVCNWYTKEDGNLYCYPNSYYVPSDYDTYDNISSNQTFLVRKDIYEAIGSPDMTTPEGFQAAVEKAVEMFPEVNGKPLIPIGAHEFTDTGCVSFDQYLQNFLAIPYETDGVYYDRYTDAEYIRWLKMFRELGSEGYLEDDIFIDQRTQMEEKLSVGQYFCMIYQRTDMEDQEKILYANDPDSIYIAIDGPKNSNGDDPVLPGAGINGWTVTLISKNCSRPDRAIDLFSYLISQHGQEMTYLGVEGVTYDWVDNSPKLKESVNDLLNSDRAKFDSIYGADNAYWMFQDDVLQLSWLQKEADDPISQMEKWTYPYTEYLGQYEINFALDTDEGNADAKIKKLWSETLPSLLLAPSEEEFEQILEDFIEQREQLDYALVMEESTRQMNESKKKLGIE